MSLDKRGSRNGLRDTIDKLPFFKENEFKESVPIELPSIWKKNSRQICEHGSQNRVKKIGFDCQTQIATQIDRVSNLLFRANKNIGQLISQAIFSNSNKRMSLTDIKHWFENSPHKMRPDTKAIEDCLYSSGYFREIKSDSHHSYWEIDEVCLSKQPFGQYILDTGIIGGFEYWSGKQHYS